MTEQDQTLAERWDGSAGRYTDEQYARACVLDRNDCQDAGDMTAKQRYSLPVANPGQSWRDSPDRGGVAAAAGRLDQTTAGAGCKQGAARRLVQCYSKLGMTAPDAVKALAQSTSAASARPPRDGLVRAVMPGPELRDTSVDGSLGILHGHFAVFNEWTEIDSIFEGRFMERIAPGAFAKTFREHRDGMRVLFQHGRDPVIGSKPLGPIDQLSEDSQGAAYEAPLLDTSYNRDLLPGLRAGLYGASFKFRVLREELDMEPKRTSENPDGIPERTVTEAQVYEFGPVTFPAYSQATAGVRSLTDEFILKDFDAADPDRLRQIIDYIRGSTPAPDIHPGDQPPHPETPPEAPPPTTPSLLTSSLGAAPDRAPYHLRPEEVRKSWQW
jgi:HK97 family phage prohead protease